MHQRHIFFVRVVIFFGVFTAPLFSMHNISRYFPLLERPEPYKIPNFGETYIAPFFTEATAASAKGERKIGIPTLWGIYNLRNIINGLQEQKAACEQPFVNPFSQIPGFESLVGKSLIYNQEGRIRSIGAYLEYNQSLPYGFILGANIAAMQVNSNVVYFLDCAASDPIVNTLPQNGIDTLDAVRRQVQCELGLVGTDWSASGVSDLDLYLRWQHEWKYKLMMRSINATITGGVLFPTSRKQDFSQVTSIPFMGNGHWGAYGDLLAEFELQTNWRFGLMFGVLKYFGKTECSRINIACAPLIYSAAFGELYTDPGITLKFSPYFTLENVLDGLHLHFRFTVLDHKADCYIDKRSAEQQKKVPNTLLQQKQLSAWRSNYITFSAIYDTKAACKKWPLTPTFYFTYDHPIDTWSFQAAMMHQVTCGVELHF